MAVSQINFARIDADVLLVHHGYFWKGDTVQVKFSSIPKTHYDFWRTLENDGGDSPFSAPVKIKSNINNGFGIWAGYASRYYTVIVPE